nr:hypothetical protein [Sicyoidochytrium minutum DNA virus]
MPREEEFSRLMQAKQIVVRNKLAFAVALFIFFGIIAFVIAAIVGGLFENEDEDGGGSTSPSPSPSPTPTPTPTPSPAPTPTPTPTPTPPPPAVYVNDVQPYRITREDILGMAISISLVALVGLGMGIFGLALGFFGFILAFGLVLAAICLAMAIYGYTQGWPYISRSKNYSSFIDQNESTKQFASKGTTVLTALACCFAGFIFFYIIGEAINARFRGRTSLAVSGARRVRGGIGSGLVGIRERGRALVPFVRTASQVETDRRFDREVPSEIKVALEGKRLTRNQKAYLVSWVDKAREEGVPPMSESARRLLFSPEYDPRKLDYSLETNDLLTSLYTSGDTRFESAGDVTGGNGVRPWKLDLSDPTPRKDGVSFNDVYLSLSKKRYASVMRKKNKLNEAYNAATREDVVEASRDPKALPGFTEEGAKKPSRARRLAAAVGSRVPSGPSLSSIRNRFRGGADPDGQMFDAESVEITEASGEGSTR